MLRTLILAAACAGAALLALPLLAQSPAGPQLSTDTLPAAGLQRAELEVPSFGRVAVMTRSLQGASVQLVDRATGPGPRAGAPGQSDGRLDLFLEAGRYRVEVQSAPGSRGEVALITQGFAEQSGTPLPRLVPEQLVSATLEDFQQRSYWVDLREAVDPFAVEVIGRSLGDLRLWRDGAWLVDATPRCADAEPTAGQPQRRCELSAALPPALYLLTVYGGPARPWAEGEGQPLHLRWGVPTLLSGRAEGVISPFGRDRYRFEEAADLLELTLPEARPVALRAAAYNPANPYAVGGSQAQITDSSREPRVLLRTGRLGPPGVVELSGAPGQPWALLRLKATDRRPVVVGEGPTLLATVHTSTPSDSVDATGVLVRTDTTPQQLVAEQALQVGAEPWRRRFNLMGPAELYLRVPAGSTLHVQSQGTALRHRVKPFWLRTPKGTVDPEWQRGDTAAWADLPGELLVLELNPETPGVAILQLTALPPGEPPPEGEAPEAAPRPSVVLPPVDLDPKGRYQLALAAQPEVAVGLIQRRLPLDLREPLDLSLTPGQALVLPVRGVGLTVLRAHGEREGLGLRVDSGLWSPEPALPAGEHTVELRNLSQDALRFTLAATAPDAGQPRPLPRVGQAELDALPRFPALRLDTTQGVDLEPSGEATFALRIEEAGLYALRSTGELTVQGRLRTRTVTELAADARGGPGENFLIQRWLDPGDYQLTVRSASRVAGHVGVRVQRLPLREGGPLRDGAPGRAELTPGEGAAWTLRVDEPGTWEVDVVGLGRSLALRLDEAAGWPVVPPGTEGPLTLALEPGQYQLIALPDAVGGRVQALARRQAEPPRLEGHGPHALPWDLALEHTWREPTGEAPRSPDVWTFTLPAAATVRIGASADMHGVLLRAEPGGAQEAARLGPGQGFTGALPAGDYRLELLHSRRSDRAAYTVWLGTEELVVGQSRPLGVPGRVLVAVGAEGTVELESLGGTDVEARLLDPWGREVAHADDRPGDWNFLLSEALAPGVYTLALSPVGVPSGQTTVRMRALRAVAGPTLRPGQAQLVEPGAGALLLPLELGAEPALIALGASAQEAVGLALEAQVQGVWRRVDSATGPAPWLLARSGGAEAWRARVWSADGRALPATVRFELPPVAQSNEAALGRGLALWSGRGARPEAAALRVPLAQAGVVVVEGGPPGLRWCPRPGEACGELPRGGLPLAEAELWLAAALTAESPRAELRAAPLRLGTDPGAAPTRLELPEGARAQLKVAGEGLTLVLALADAGQPGLALGAAGTGGVALGPRAAVALSAAPDPTLALWSAAGGPLPVALRAYRFASPTPTPAAGGLVELSLAPGQAVALALDAPALAELALTPGIVAAELQRGAPTRLAWSPAEALSERWPQAQGTLVLLNPTAAPAQARVALFPAGPGPLQVRAGAPLEQVAAAAGRARVQVSPSAGVLWVAGAATQATLLRDDGVVLRGELLPLSGHGGVLWVDHGPGRWLTWASTGAGDLGRSGLWTGAAPPPTPQPLPGARALGGERLALALAPGQAGALTVRVTAPALVVLALDTPNGETLAEPRLLEAGDSAAFTLPAAGGTLLLRGLGGQPLSGGVELGFSPATPAGEGLGPERLLAPGSAALVQFTVTRAGPVGLGLRGDPARFQLSGADGRPLPAQGASAQIELQPGDYLLRLELPPEAPPTRVRAALVGLVPPPDTPPAEVIESYRALSSAPPAPEGDL